MKLRTLLRFTLPLLAASISADQGFHLMDQTEIERHNQAMATLKGQAREDYRNRTWNLLRERARKHGYLMPETPPWVSPGQASQKIETLQAAAPARTGAAASTTTETSPSITMGLEGSSAATQTTAKATMETAKPSTTAGPGSEPPVTADSESPVKGDAGKDIPTRAERQPQTIEQATRLQTAETTKPAVSSAPSTQPPLASGSEPPENQDAEDSMPARIERQRQAIEQAAQAQTAEATKPHSGRTATNEGPSPAARSYREQMRRRFEAYMAQRQARRQALQAQRDARRQQGPRNWQAPAGPYHRPMVPPRPWGMQPPRGPMPSAPAWPPRSIQQPPAYPPYPPQAAPPRPAPPVQGNQAPMARPPYWY